MSINIRNILVLAVLLAFSACSKEDSQPVIDEGPVEAVEESPVFHASTESPEQSGTKVYLGENLKVLWNNADFISVFNGSTLHETYRFTGRTGDQSGDFEKMDEGEPSNPQPLDAIYAAYPCSYFNTITSDGVMTINLPSEQAYAVNSFGQNCNLMVAKAPVNTTDFFFKNVGGYLRLKLYGTDVAVTEVIITGNNGEYLAGDMEITIGADNIPSSSIVENGARSKKVRINSISPLTIGSTAENATEFNFVLPPVTFANGFTITVIGTSGGVKGVFKKSTTKNFVIQRSHRVNMAALNVTLEPFVEFEDESFKAYCVANFDADGDGEISKSEAMDVTQIECYNCSTTGDYYTEEIGGKTVHFMKASSLKGIEEFKNLMELIVRGAYTTHPGVSGPLTELNLSENSNLQYLDCSINDIASLDISNSPYLQYLDVSETKLLSLYVPEYTYLQKLYCYNCQDLAYINCLYDSNLTDFHFEGSYSLEYLLMGEIKFNRALDLKYYTELKEVNCMNSGVTFINFSGHTGCTELKNLYVQGNNLTEITGLSTLTSLKQLTCQGNKIETLDIHSNPALTLLRAWPQQEGTTLHMLVLSPAQADAISAGTLMLYDNSGSISDSEVYTKYGTIFDMHY